MRQRSKPLQNNVPKPLRASNLSYRGKLPDLETARDEDKLARILNQAVQDALNGDYYQTFCKEAKKAYKFFEGDQWLDSGLETSWAPDWRYRTARNICFGTVETLRGMMTDLRPTPIFSADFPDEGVSEIRQQLAQGITGQPYDILNDADRFKIRDRDIARHLNSLSAIILTYSPACAVRG